MTEEARKARNAYYREWRAKNKNKVRESNRKYWENKKEGDAMTEEKREDLRKFVAEQQGETVAPSEEEAMAEKAVNALVSISVTLEKILNTQRELRDTLKKIQRIG